MIDTPPPGFRGLAPDKPVTVYRRHLPHWRQEGATYYVTFRLADSLPATKLAELRCDREAWRNRCPNPSDKDQEELLRSQMEKMEAWLDEGHGSCILKRGEFAQVVEDCLRFFDAERYALFSATIMSNHVHACVKPQGKWELDAVLKGWKSVSSRQINPVLGRKGRLWQDESYDRIVRDTQHLRRVVKYIEANPKQAGVEARCWTTPMWDEWMNRD